MGSLLKVNCCAEMKTSYFGPQNQEERAWLCNLGGKTEGGGILDRALGHPLDNLQVPFWVHVCTFICTCCILIKQLLVSFYLYFEKVHLVLTNHMENSIPRTVRWACTQCSLFSLGMQLLWGYFYYLQLASSQDEIGRQIAYTVLQVFVILGQKNNLGTNH